MKPKRVLLFDSGVGGLSVSQKLQQHFMGLQLHYLADNAWFPYGTCSDAKLADRISSYIDRLCATLQPDLIISACNTASTLVLEHLQQRLSIPVMGVLPKLAPAAALTHRGIIGLLATPATITRQYTASQINQWPDLQIKLLGCAALVMMAEQKMMGHAVDLAVMKSLLQPMIRQPDTQENPPKSEPSGSQSRSKFDLEFDPKSNLESNLKSSASIHLQSATESISSVENFSRNPDVIVMGCTHFPLLLQEFQQVCPAETQWIDPADDLIAQLKGLWPQHVKNLAPANRLTDKTLPWETTAPDDVATCQFVQFTGENRAYQLKKVFTNHGFVVSSPMLLAEPSRVTAAAWVGASVLTTDASTPVSDLENSR